MRLVGAHAWDIAGALREGIRRRPGMVFDPLVEAPDIVGSDLADVADRIVEMEIG